VDTHLNPVIPGCAVKQRQKGNLQNWKHTAAIAQLSAHLNIQLAFFGILLSLTVRILLTSTVA